MNLRDIMSDEDINDAVIATYEREYIGKRFIIAEVFPPSFIKMFKIPYDEINRGPLYTKIDPEDDIERYVPGQYVDIKYSRVIEKSVLIDGKLEILNFIE